MDVETERDALERIAGALDDLADVVSGDDPEATRRITQTRDQLLATAARMADALEKIAKSLEVAGA